MRSKASLSARGGYGKGKKKGKSVKMDCVTCQQTKKPTDFYLSNSDFHAMNENRYPICKDCVKSRMQEDDCESVKAVLAEMNRPFVASLWKSSYQEHMKTNKSWFGIYYKNLLLNHKHLTFKDSHFGQGENFSSLPFLFDEASLSLEREEKKQEPLMGRTKKKQVPDFEVTDEMLRRWGAHYDGDAYFLLEQFYHDMKKSNRIETAQEEAYLKKLAVISMQMDLELRQGNIAQVKQLGDLFSKFMADSKFRAMDKTEADMTGGVRNFSTIFAECEADEHIPPWTYYQELYAVNQDIVDKTLLYFINYTKRVTKQDLLSEPPEDTPKLDESVDDRWAGER